MATRGVTANDTPIPTININKVMLFPNAAAANGDYDPG